MKFGIEIELVNVDSHSDLRRAIRSHLREENLDDSGWSVKYDGSLNSLGAKGGAEVVSPALTHGPSSLRAIEIVCKAIREYGGFVNDTCGVHVHVDVRSYKADQILNIVQTYAENETHIDSFMTSPRRDDNAEYCRSMVKHIANPATLVQDFRTQHYHRMNDSTEGLICEAARWQRAIERRYSKVNVYNAFVRHGTIEFRQHHATINSDELLAWVDFLKNLVELSVEYVGEQSIHLAGRTEIRRVTETQTVVASSRRATFETFGNWRCLQRIFGWTPSTVTDERMLTLMRAYFSGQTEFTTEELRNLFNNVGARRFDVDSLPAIVSHVNQRIQEIEARSPVEAWTDEDFTCSTFNRLIHRYSLLSDSSELVRREELLTTSMRLPRPSRFPPFRLKKVRNEERYRFVEQVSTDAMPITVNVTRNETIQHPGEVVTVPGLAKITMQQIMEKIDSKHRDLLGSRAQKFAIFY